jgi:hypothetical protein
MNIGKDDLNDSIILNKGFQFTDCFLKNVKKLVIADTVNIITIARSAVSATYSPLLASKDYLPAGNVHVGHVGGSTTVTITYTTEDGWEIIDTHLGVVKDFDDFPTTKNGNPKIGYFAKKTLGGYPTSITDTEVIYEIDIGTYTGPLFIAAHAVVWHPIYGEETAWANTGLEFPGNSWALYFEITIT